MKTKVISLLLCLVMALSLVPAALAEGETVPAPRLTLNGKAASAKEDVPAGEAALNVENAQDAAILWEKETEELNEKNEPIWQELGRSAALTLTINEGETLTLRCTLTQSEKDAVVLPLTLKGVAPVAEEVPAEEEAQQPAESPLLEADATAQPEAEPSVEPSVEPSAEPSVEPSVEPTAEPKDYTELYEQFMTTQTVEELNALWDSFAGEEEWEEFQAWLEANDKLAALNAHIEEITPEGDPVLPSIKRFTKVGPLLSAPVLRRANGLRAAANDSENNSGVVLNKNAEAVDDGYKITMEAYATGESTTVVSTEPVDIVLVLDVSGSMNDCIVCGEELPGTHTVYKTTYDVNPGKKYYIQNGGKYIQVKYCDGDHGLSWNKHSASWVPTNLSDYGNSHANYVNTNGIITPKKNAEDTTGVQFYIQTTEQCTARIDSLKSAVNGFIDNVAEKSPDSQIAIVKFAGNKSNQVGNDKYQDGRFTYNYSQIVEDLSTVSDKKAALKSAINALSPAGATQANYGMELAQSIIDKVKDDGRKKVVIMFTDGEPTSQSSFETNVANAAISASKSIKDTGATVYTIGVFAGADGTPVTNLNSVSNTNKYMHLVSSNYKTATNMNNTGEATYPDGGKSYFLSAGSHIDLMSIFTQISQEVGGSTIKLDSSSYIQDTVTQQFTMPEGTDAVEFYTMDCNGKDSFDESTKTKAEGVTYEITGNTLKVTNFDFSANWCGTKDGVYRGKKLIIEFTVKAKTGFLGGNNVLTNVGEGDGIYNKDGEVIGSFTPPTVNVPIPEVTVTAQDKNVYLLGGVSQDEMKQGATIKCGNVNISDPSKLEDWQKAYVEIDVVCSSATSGMTEDGTYTITATVKSKAESESNKQSANAGAKINVFKPELTFKDSTVYYGAVAPTQEEYDATNKVSELWKHGETPDTTVSMSGEKPTLDITYNTPTLGGYIENGKINTLKDIEVSVGVKINGTDVKANAEIKHQVCVPACGWTEALPLANFLLHVKSCDLTIKKEGWKEIDENQSFIFTVKIWAQDGTEEKVLKSFKVAIQGNKSVTIKGIPAGVHYTITEDSSWSWRYDAPDATGVLKPGPNSVTITNSRSNGKWLGGDAYCQNHLKPYLQ